MPSSTARVGLGLWNVLLQTEVPMSIWASGSPYEACVGRLSRLVAREFLPWLAVPGGSRWLELGCKTGALSAAMLREAKPAIAVGTDPSAGFIAYARGHVRDERATFAIADAQALPFAADSLVRRAPWPR